MNSSFVQELLDFITIVVRNINRCQDTTDDNFPARRKEMYQIDDKFEWYLHLSHKDEAISTNDPIVVTIANTNAKKRAMEIVNLLNSHSSILLKNFGYERVWVDMLQ